MWDWNLQEGHSRPDTCCDAMPQCAGANYHANGVGITLSSSVLGMGEAGSLGCTDPQLTLSLLRCPLPSPPCPLPPNRSLSSFQQLLSDKSSCLAHPDVLISAVGTKIYNWDGRAWQEDAGWVRSLDAGWRVEVVREAAYAALAKVGGGAAAFFGCCWLCLTCVSTHE
jgi:hypothetical protein